MSDSAGCASTILLRWTDRPRLRQSRQVYQEKCDELDEHAATEAVRRAAKARARELEMMRRGGTGRERGLKLDRL